MLRQLFILSVLFSAGSAFAQKSKDTTANRDLTFVDSYRPKFIEAQKIESVPVIVKPELKTVTFSYSIKPHQVSTEKIVNPIPVVDLNTKEETLYPTSFVKLGYGNIQSKLGEIYLNNKQNKQYSYGLHYRFLESNSELNNSFADFTNHAFKGYISTYTEIGELGLDINYKNNQFNFYGYDTANKLAEKNLARTINSFDARAYFNSTAISDKKLKHRTQFNFYNFQVGEAVENQYALSTKLYGNIPNFSDLKNVQLSANIGVDYNTYKFDTLSPIKRLFIQFDPRMSFEYDGMQISAGFNTTIFMNVGDSALVYPNPFVKVNYPIVPGIANLYGGIDGRYNKQSLRNIMQTNPYTTNYELINTFVNSTTYIGINAKLGAAADALFEINYSDITAMPLFVTLNNPLTLPMITKEKDSLNSFGTRYVQMNLLKFSAAFNYSFSEAVRMGFQGNFYNYNSKDETEAWQMPNIDGKLNMKFNIKNKLYPHFDILAMGIQKQRSGLDNLTKQTSTIKAFYDISVGIDYRFKKKLSVFVQANNILNTRYQRWFNYPVYGFNILGGVTMIF